MKDSYIIIPRKNGQAVNERLIERAREIAKEKSISLINAMRLATNEIKR